MKKLSILFLIILCLFTCSCGKKKSKSQEQSQEKDQILDIKTSHKWYYFSADGFIQVDKPQNSPFLGSTPYTEAIRISSANNATNNDTGNKAFALVNRLGVLCFDGDKISIAKDVSVFADRTADNLVFVNNQPIFSVYKSLFFNDTIGYEEYKKNQNEHMFLVQFDELSKISYPIINCQNLLDVENSEVVDFVWNGEDWFCCVKSVVDSSGKTDFSYLKFSSVQSIASVSPVTAKNNIVVKQSSVDEFRNAKNVIDYKNAPERIRKMLENFSTTIPFVMEVKSAGGSSPRVYENILLDSKEQELNSKAIISQSWSCVLFEDGTLFIEGALPGKHILRGGKPVAIRLPKLPGGYVYSDFVISGTNLYAAWEETDFYKVNRSGFIQVDLDSTLYSKIR